MADFMVIRFYLKDKFLKKFKASALTIDEQLYTEANINVQKTY